jgi:hypothetical protein
VNAPSDVHQLLTGASEVLDQLRYQEKDLEERLARVRERLAAGEAVLVAVERWQSLPAAWDQAAPAVPAAASPVPSGQPPLIELIALLLAQDPARTWTPDQVHHALDVPAASVHSGMSRLEKRGRLVRVEHGAYRAAPPGGRG